MKKSILILEDKTDASKVYLDRLDDDFDVAVAFNNAGARELTKEVLFDALIVDIDLGEDEECGDVFAKEYKFKHPETLVYIATGLKDYQIPIGLDADRFYEKPLNIHEVFEHLSADLAESENEMATGTELEKRINAIELHEAKCETKMEARMTALEQTTHEIKVSNEDVKGKLNKFLGAAIALQALTVIIIAAVSAYANLVK